MRFQSTGPEDVEAAHAVLKPLIDQGKTVIMIGHSYGGWTATESAQPALQAKSREVQSGGIVCILYMGAFVFPVGESISSFFQPKDGTFVTPPFMTFHISCNISPNYPGC
jgi:pimeloyl-ACP methyl ester carboxylesterase